MPDLEQVLGLHYGERLAIIGSGGKTTLLMRFASLRRWGAVLTTTTHLAPPAQLRAISQSDSLELPTPVDYGVPFIPFTDNDSFAAAYYRLSLPRVCLTGKLAAGASRLQGLTGDQVDQLATNPNVGLLVVEADGSKRLPVKLHASFEPVLFNSCSYGIAVLGMKAWGRPLQQGQVHRPELMQQYLQAPPEHILTAVDLVRVAISYLEHLPAVPKALVLSQMEWVAPDLVLQIAKEVQSFVKQHQVCELPLRILGQSQEELILLRS